MVMVPTAISQVIEQVVRVGTVFLASYFLLKDGVEFVAAGATFGAVTGSFAALIALIIYFCWWRYKYYRMQASKGNNTSIISIIKRVAILAVPISLGGLVMPLMQTIDAAMVPLRLQQAGFDVSKATALFGQFSGMAATLINLPTIITISLAASLVPAISDALAKANQGLIVNRLNEAIRLTIMLCLPAALGLFLLSEEIAILLYGIPEVGVSISVLAPAALFLGLHQTTAGAIQGLGKTFLPVKHLFIGAIVKVALNYYLTAMPALGIRGAGFATVASFIVAFLLNLRYLQRHTFFKLNLFYHLLKPGIAATIMAISIKYTGNIVNSSSGLGTLLLIMIGVMAYGLALLVIGGIKGQDLEIIPGVGPKLAAFMTKLGIVRW
ncbi:MAG: polysaccharide biosynthesis protein, partial [Bacillota bacterium]|nr:polysaccharide biosynthesis protein [Bacillota bacterium]